MRRLVDEEAEPQVVAGERRHVLAQPLAGPQAREHAGRDLRADDVVPDERDPTLGADPPGLRLGDVVQERSEAQRLPPRELVGQRLVQEPGNRRRVRAEPLLGMPRQLDRRGEHQLRVLVHVEVVVLALLDAAHPAELRQDHIDRADRVHQREALQSPVGDHDPLELGEHALGRDLGQLRRALAAAAAAVSRSTSNSSSQASLARRSVRSGSSTNARGDTIRSAARGHVRQPAERVDVLAAAERLGDRVDREVALCQVGLDRPADHREHVDLPAVVAGNDAPDAERLRQRERVRVQCARERPGHAASVAGNRDVVVVGRPPEEPVAYRPADQPGRFRRRDRDERFERAR